MKESPRPHWRERISRTDAGDTLVEVLLAMVIIAITATSILAAFQTAIGATAEEGRLAQINTILKSYAEVATAEIQENSPELYVSCATTSTYQLTGLPTLPTGYSVSISSITYWNGSAFVSSCTSGSSQPQLITLKATGPGSISGTLSFVVSELTYVQPPQVAAAFSVSSPYVLTEAVGTSWTYTLTTSKGSPVPVLTTSTLPTGVSFVDNGDGTGTLTGASSIASGTYTLTFTATNSVGSPAVLTMDLVIATPPTFTSATTVSYAAGSRVNFTVSASDTDAVPPALALDTTLTGALKNLSFVDNGNGTGTLSGTLVSGSTGTYTLTFEADNSVGVATLQNVTFTIPTVPTFTSASAVSWVAGSTVSWTVSATDSDSASPSLALNTSLTGALRNLNFVDNGNGTGTLSGTLVSGTTGTYTLTFQATNTAGQSATQTFTVTVPTAPVFTSSSSVSWVAGTHVSYTISATDTDKQSPTFSISSLSGDAALTGLSFVDNGNGTATLSGTLVSGKTGVYTVTVTAKNSAGQSTNQTLTISVPTVPVFSGSTSFTTTKNSTVNWTFTATDTDSSSPTLSISSYSGDAALVNLTFTNNGNGTATFSGTLASNKTGTYTLTVTATNTAGQTATESITITVNI